MLQFTKTTFHRSGKIIFQNGLKNKNKLFKVIITNSSNCTKLYKYSIIATLWTTMCI